MMTFLRAHIHHVMYVVKENRSYDQVLGDLGRGNGDPSLTLVVEPLSPNHHALARQFVTLDNFMDSGESSNTGRTGRLRDALMTSSRENRRLNMPVAAWSTRSGNANSTATLHRTSCRS